LDTVITKMPELVQLIGQTNAYATNLILTRENSESKKQLIVFILARIDPALETIDNGLQTAANENPSLPGKLSLPIRTHIEAVQAFDDMLRRQVLDAGPSNFAKLDLKSVNANGLNTLDSSSALYDASVGVLDDLVATRVGRFNQRQALSLIIAGVSVLIALQFIASIGRSISKLLAELKEVTDRADKGNLSAPPTLIGTMKIVSGRKRSADCRQIYKAAIK
jgi:methyl-accepting chemotaxis protein